MPMFPSGHFAAHAAICAGSLLASFCHSPMRGCFPELRHAEPFEHEHTPPIAL